MEDSAEDEEVDFISNPLSKYEERMEIPGLTLYDIHRPTFKLVDEEKKILLQDFQEELSCPICLGIMKQTTIVMECAHRFCKECIETSLRQHKNECPTCRLHIPTRRSLRPNQAFDCK